MHRAIPLLVAIVAPVQARAASCVELDPERDNLSAEDLKAAGVLFEDALSDAGRTVGPAPCEEAWALTHTRLGDSITVRVGAMGRADKLAVTGLEELPLAYERLVRGLIADKPAAGNPDRSSVTTDDAEKKRVSADSLFALRVGFGLLPGTLQGGPALGGGYRFELDRLAIDVGLAGTIPTGESEFFTARGTLGALVFIDPEASATPYVGGGLGLGGSASDDGAFFGAVAVATAGYSLMRETQLRLFPQVDFTMPIGATDQGAWAPDVSLTVGVAFIPPSRNRRSR